MRVAMIHTPFETRSGGERQILRLAIELQKMGHEVEVFTNSLNKETYPEYFSKLKINVIKHPLAGKVPPEWTPYIIQPKNILHQKPTSVFSRKTRQLRKLKGLYYTNHLPYMIEIGRKIPKKFDIINNHNLITEWAGFVAKSRLKVPLVWMCNEPPLWFFSKAKTRFHYINWPIFEVLDKTAVQFVDEILVLSHVAEGYVKKAYNRQSRIVRTGLDIELFHNAKGDNLRKKYCLENTFVMLFVGGSMYAKRSDAVRTLSILSKKYDNIRLIIDTHREQEMLSKLSEQLGVKDKLLLLNSRSDIELSEVYAACNVFIYPSSAGTWGLVVTEAMAAGKPVILSKQVGTAEIVTDQVNGLIVDQTTPQALAQQVEKLLNDPKLCSKIGTNAYLNVKNNLSWEKYAKTIENIFQETLKAKKHN